MKHILITTISAVLLVGCGESQQPAAAPETHPTEPVAEVSAQQSPRLSSGSRPTTGRSSGTTSSRSGSSPSRTSSSRSGSVSSLGGTRTTRAVPTRARRTYPTPPPMEGGDPAVQALEMMHQKDLAESKGVPMPPLPFQQQLEDAPPADVMIDRPPRPPGIPPGPDVPPTSSGVYLDQRPPLPPVPPGG